MRRDDVDNPDAEGLIPMHAEGLIPMHGAAGTRATSTEQDTGAGKHWIVRGND
jgi:hypothetical protein